MINPLIYLNRIVEDRKTAGIQYYNAFALSTASDNLKEAPSSRIVLAKAITEDSVYFYTNYESKKAIEISRIPKVSALFYFPDLSIQVRIKGDAIKLGDDVSDEYWNTRSYLSRVGSTVSKQSRILSYRLTLYWKVIMFMIRHGKTVPRPKNWGGYAIAVDEFEIFYMGAGRLHTRKIYKKCEDGGWGVDLLYP